MTATLSKRIARLVMLGLACLLWACSESDKAGSSDSLRIGLLPDQSEQALRERFVPLLEYLYRQVTRPEYSFRLRWRENTLAMWDNRCTQHYALNDYHGYRRVMHRIIIEGGRP